MRAVIGTLDDLHCTCYGGAGCIGSVLSERVLDEGLRVVVIGITLTVKKENIASLRGWPNFRLIEGDLLDRSLLDSCAGRQQVHQGRRLRPVRGRLIFP